MKGRVKEDEKNEKIIRGLSKLPTNHRCINCNSLGPQYVCTTFWTFVCATCGGIHREFTHRVKSVSMATFSSEEVVGLKEGGNERAKEVYFKEWDPQCQSVRDNCDMEELRKFIKHLYVDRRYTGEKSTDHMASTPKMVDNEDSFTHRSPNRVDREGSFNHSSGPFSPPYLDIYEGCCMERSESNEKRDERDSGNNTCELKDHGHGKKSQMHDDDRKKIFAYFEEVDDSFREGISETSYSKNHKKCPLNHYDRLASSGRREVRSLRDILDRISSLRLSGAPKVDGGRPADSSLHMQRTTSTRETRHINGNSMEPKRLNSMRNERKNIESPVNVGSNPKPASQAQQSPKSTKQPTRKPTSSPNSNNSLSIDCSTQKNRLKAASNAKNLEPLDPAADPMGNVSLKLTGGILTAKILNMSRAPRNKGASPVSPVSNVLTSSPSSNLSNPKAALASAELSSTTSAGISSSEKNHVTEKQRIPPPQSSIFPDSASQSTSHVSASFQNLQSSQFFPQNIPELSSAFLMESIPSAHTLSGKKEFSEGRGTDLAVLYFDPSEQKSSGGKEVPQGLGTDPAVLHSGPSEQKPSGRKELPQHLSTATYSSAPVLSPVWQPVQAHGMGYSMQYSSEVQMPTVFQEAKSEDTFDLNNGTNLLQSPMMSSLTSWHGTQPNVIEARILLQPTSLGYSSTQWVPGQSSFYGTVPFQPLSSTLEMPLSSHMGQQVPNMLQPPAGCQQGVEVVGKNVGVFSTLNSSQHPAGIYYSTTTSQRSSFSVGGNPFA